jgi:hypothetical protein
VLLVPFLDVYRTGEPFTEPRCPRRAENRFAHGLSFGSWSECVVHRNSRCANSVEHEQRGTPNFAIIQIKTQVKTRKHPGLIHLGRCGWLPASLIDRQALQIKKPAA